MNGPRKNTAITHSGGIIDQSTVRDERSRSAHEHGASLYGAEWSRTHELRQEQIGVNTRLNYLIVRTIQTHVRISYR